MTHGTRGGFVVVSLVAIAAAAYLYNKQLNLEAERLRIARHNTLIEGKTKCAVDGKSFFDQYWRSQAAVASGRELLWDDPEFHYNSELETCLVKTRSVELGDPTYQHAIVTDLSTNKPVAESYVGLWRDEKSRDLTEKPLDAVIGAPNLTRAAFQVRAAELMKK